MANVKGQADKGKKRVKVEGLSAARSEKRQLTTNESKKIRGGGKHLKEAKLT